MKLGKTTIVLTSGLTTRILALEKRHGSLRAAARALQIDHGYLSRLKAGKKLDPGDAVLRKLGVRCVVSFVTAASTGRKDG